MISIPRIGELAGGGNCEIQLLLELVDGAGDVHRYANGDHDETLQLDGEARTFAGGDTPLISVSPPRMGTNLERQELAVVLASDDTREIEQAFTTGSPGRMTARLWMRLGAPVGAVVDLFRGHYGSIAVDASNQLLLTFAAGFGQLDAQRSIALTDAEQRAFAPTDDSLSKVQVGGVVIWGRTADGAEP